MGDAVGLDGDALGTSRLVAKVDSAAVQDGFDIYLHSFVVADNGAWTVIQQGMNTDRRQARRYHWLSEGLKDFVDAPHAAIDGPPQGVILNLTDHRSAAARQAQVDLVAQGPDHVVEALRRLPRLEMPAHHDVRISDVRMRRLRGNLAAATERGPEDFAEILLTPGVGARTVEALALVAEVIHGAPSRFSDPARFAMAHGGKDGHPFPVPIDVYDHTLGVLREAVERGRLGQDDKLAALRRLDAESRLLERSAEDPAFDLHLARERRQSTDYGGRTVFGPAKRKPSAAAPRKGQLDLPGMRSRS